MSAAHVPERLIRVTNEHWVKYFFTVFLVILLLGTSVLTFVLAGYMAFHNDALSLPLSLGALTLFLFAFHWFFFTLLNESMAHVVVTNHRVVRIHERMFREELITEYAFEKMKTVQANYRGILQTILRYGSIKFESGPPIQYVPHPGSIAKDIEQAMGMH